MATTNLEFRLIDFSVNDVQTRKGQPRKFTIQMFGLNENGKSASITVTDFKPFFYVKVGDNWNIHTLERFKKEIRERFATDELSHNYSRFINGITKFIKPRVERRDDSDDYETESEYVERCLPRYQPYIFKSIDNWQLVNRHKLYGFDNKKLHTFVAISFINENAMRKVKNIWYKRIKDRTSKFGFTNKLRTVHFIDCYTELYEAKLPSLLRLFHIKNISPSGWIRLPANKYRRITQEKDKKTHCDFELSINYKNIVSLPNKETAVPLKICSFDIEASSSHGDFPVAKKTYKKLATDIVNHWLQSFNDIQELATDEQQKLLQTLILTAFGYRNADGINVVYSKRKHTQRYVTEQITDLITKPLRSLLPKTSNELVIPNMCVEEEDTELYSIRREWGTSCKMRTQRGGFYLITSCLNDTKVSRTNKIELIDSAMTNTLKRTLPLEGDKVTFIGSTFMRMGEDKPYLHHGVCLNDCVCYEDIELIESYDDEGEMLMGWTDIIREEKPDIIIGYNIFGFDWKFMCDRADELHCFDEFSQLGKIKHKKCIKETKQLRIASGAHELTYIDIDGIIQIDLYNYFRREVNLGSYKLQNVAAHFIGDMVNSVEHYDEYTIVKSKYLMGLQEGNYVIFEILSHSNDEYEGGRKFEVCKMNEKSGEFWIKGHINIPEGKKLRWGLGKDDVSPQDLFRLANGDEEDRYIIAKYCFQDCNLVHHLLRKNDVITGMIEIASICYVPIDFIIMRGQGIKLLSFVAKKCREKNTLMPVIDKVNNDGSYEGATVLAPKKAFYTNKPVAVVDYASLYPSSMISENISHDSKVWTKEYDLDGNLLKETGDAKYDNLETFEYVDIEYDMYSWIAPPGKKKEEKTLVGKKICRYAQFPNDGKAIMPSILKELLSARKATRKLIKYKTVNTADGQSISGLLTETDDEIIIKNKNGETRINKERVRDTHDTYNDFMKNVFNQRQLGYKVTANSLYGQCGARTSAFYDKDIAASTTATGRKLLIYGKRIIEEVYGDCICDTKYGKVISNAEYIYGDTDSVFFTFNLKNLDGTEIIGKRALEITIDLAIEAGQLASKFLKPPHDLEYEKTFDPFLLLSKKRYVGMLYETNPNKCKRKSMGIVLKRRDNANVVKDIYGGNIDILMNGGNINESIGFTRKFLQDIVSGKIDTKKLIISKSLRDWYKNPQSIAHKVLADRMGKRDPGNKPAVGSRIPYIYIQTKGNVKLQGDKIEHPDYVREHGLKPDYSFYITNQIMKPLTQIFALVLEQIPEFKPQLSSFKRKLRMLDRKYKDPVKRENAETKIRNAEVKKIIFSKSLRQADNLKSGQRMIESFFS